MLRKAAYTRPTSGHAYDEADILFEGEIIERITVGHPKTVAKKPKKKTSRKSARKADEEIAGEKEKGCEEEETTLGGKRRQARHYRRRDHAARDEEAHCAGVGDAAGKKVEMPARKHDNLPL